MRGERRDKKLIVPAMRLMRMEIDQQPVFCCFHYSLIDRDNRTVEIRLR
jgi:hypothetical protein